MNHLPHEFMIGGVFMPPIFIAAILAIVVTHFVAKLLNRLGLAKYFFYPPLVYVALVVIFTVAIGSFIIPY